MDKLKLIKTIVVVLTFLLVFGTLILLGNIIKKTRQSATPLPKQISLNQPHGSQISEMLEKDGNLYLLVKDGGQADRVVIINPKDSSSISTIQLN